MNHLRALPRDRATRMTSAQNGQDMITRDVACALERAQYPLLEDERCGDSPRFARRHRDWGHARSVWRQRQFQRPFDSFARRRIAS